MTSSMTSSESIERIKGRLGEITSYDPDDLGVNPDLGAVNFKDSQPLFRRIIEFAKGLQTLPLEELPETGVQWGNLHQVIEKIAETLRKISEFTILGEEHAENRRNDLVNACVKHHDAALNQFLPYIPYLMLRSAEVREVVAQSRQLLQEVQQILEDTKNFATDVKEDVEEIVQTTKDAAAKIGVAKFAPKFEDAAESHVDLSNRWLIASALFVFLTFTLAFVLIFPDEVSPNQPETSGQATATPQSSTNITIPSFLAKLVFVSLAYIMAVWAARNYRAHRHLEVVNRHKQNALSTFEVFVEATTDPKTKDAVLLEATRCIFGASISGYLTKEQNPSPNRIIEVIKTLETETKG